MKQLIITCCSKLRVALCFCGTGSVLDLFTSQFPAGPHRNVQCCDFIRRWEWFGSARIFWNHYPMIYDEWLQPCYLMDECATIKITYASSCMWSAYLLSCFCYDWHHHWMTTLGRAQTTSSTGESHFSVSCDVEGESAGIADRSGKCLVIFCYW